MKARYFGKNEMERYFERSEIANDLQVNFALGISSIADIIELCDQYKQNNLDGFLDHLSGFKNGPLKNGLVYISELDQHGLHSGLFDQVDEDLVFWLDGSDPTTPPLHSVRCLSLRANEYVFWDQDVYNEMLDLLG